MAEWEPAFAAMARVGRDAVHGGLVVATGGNLSVRGADPATFAVTCRGTVLDRLDDSSSFAVVALDGSILAGAEPSSEWKLHQRTYLARPDVGAIVHLHPQHTVLLDALDRPIRLLTLDHLAYVRHYRRVPFLPNGSDELADAAAQAATGCDCVVLAFHGCSTLGRTPDEAFRVALNLESAAVATYRMLLLGDQTTEFPQHLRESAIHPDYR